LNATSKVLPTPARPNKTNLSLERNAREKALGSEQSNNGRPFQIEGPTTEKACCSTVEDWRCEQKDHGEDLVQLNRGRGASST